MELLADPELLKIGASIKDDLQRLRSIEPFIPGGFIELQDLVESFQIEDKSLRKMAAIVLGIRMSKSQQLSNWESQVLTPAQARYAATDAWICLAIYNKLRREEDATHHHRS